MLFRSLVQACVEGGVRLVATSDAVRAGEVGHYRYVREIAAAIESVPVGL